MIKKIMFFAFISLAVILAPIMLVPKQSEAVQNQIAIKPSPTPTPFTLDENTDNTQNGIPNQEEKENIPEKKELNYWCMWSENSPEGRVLAKAVNKFAQEKNISVNITFNTFETDNKFQAALKEAFGNSEKIDIFDGEMSVVLRDFSQYLLPLDSYIVQSNEYTDHDAYKNTVNTAMLDLARLYSKEYSDGKLYGLPYMPFVFAIMYNKSAFMAAGITDTPKTWDEFLIACEKLKAIDMIPITTDDAYIEMLFGYHLARFNGYSGIQDIMKNDNWSDPSVLSAAQDWQNMYEQGYISAKAATNIFPAGETDFASGTVAMYLNETRMVRELKDSKIKDIDLSNFNWGTFAYPKTTNGTDDLNAAYYGSKLLAITKDSHFQDEAVLLAMYLTSKAVDSEFALATTSLPITNKASCPPELLEAREVLFSVSLWYPWKLGFPANQLKYETLKTGIKKLIGGRANAQEFVDLLAN